MFSFGIPNSFSVYTLRFFFTGAGAGFVFCCLDGGALACFDIRLLEFKRDEPDVFKPFLSLAELGLLFAVLLGAMAPRRHIARHLGSL